MAIPELVAVSSADAITSNDFDAVVLVASRFEFSALPAVRERLLALQRIDAGIGQQVGLHHVEGWAGGRLVVSPTGPVDRDIDDVRRIGDAARAGVVRARDAGAVAPLLLVETTVYPSGYERALEVAVLEALAGLWAPLEAREYRGEATMEPVQRLGFVTTDSDLPGRLTALEAGRRLSRDLGGTEPERMAPAAFAQLCHERLKPEGVKVRVLDRRASLEREYPLMMAVARASVPVERHRPRVIRLEWTGDEPIERTYWLAGKAVTYDTGGADLKTGGTMAGMSRDKGGGASVAGLMLTIARARPRGVRVVAQIGAVRNSIGAEAYVTDEIIASHAGVRVRIGNTDAEGRLVLADLLSHLRQEAQTAPRPRLFSVATLTGHSGRAVGPYSIALDNAPARKEGVAEGLSRAGELWADPFELSRLRREDFELVKARSPAEDVVSSNTAPSTQTARGHQFPMAFLAVASGLSQHGRDGDLPLPYTHVDIGGSYCEGGDWQHGRPTAAPVVALATSILEW
jgi:leucyl aminopeptidase